MSEDRGFDLNEAAPASIPRGCTGLMICNPDSRPIIPAELLRVLLSQVASRRITNLLIGSSSRLRDIGIVSAFPRLTELLVRGERITDISALSQVPGLESLDVEVPSATRDLLPILALARLEHLRVSMRKPHDYEVLGQCSWVKHLRIHNWCALDLRSLGGMSLQQLDLIRAKAERFEEPPSAARVWLASCAHLRELVLPSVRELMVESCRQLREDQFALCPRLVNLRILVQPPVTSFSFLTSLPELQLLVISKTKVAAEDFHHLLSAPSLREAWLGGSLALETLRDLSAAKPGLLVHGRQKSFRGGVAVVT